MASNGDNANSDRQDGGDVCRDFMRGLCTRGRKCKFRHPEDAGTTQRDNFVEFCHDYQNPGGCKRSNCRFVHATKQEEAIYHETGQLPARINQQPNFEIPVCKDFMYNRCDRGSNCKYRHVTQSEYDYEQDQRAAFASPYPSNPRISEYTPRGPPAPHPYDDYYAGGPMKRRRNDYYPGGGDFAEDIDLMAPPISISHSCLDCTKLKERIRSLEKQVTYLTAANEVLLEQNARIRVSGPPNSGVGGNDNAVASAAQVAHSVQLTQAASIGASMGVQNSSPLVSYPIVSQSGRLI